MNMTNSATEAATRVILQAGDFTFGMKLLLAAAGWCAIGGLFVAAVWSVLAHQIWRGIRSGMAVHIPESDKYFVIIRTAWVICAMGGVCYAGMIVALALSEGLVDRGIWTYGLSMGMILLASGYSVCLAAGSSRNFSGWLYVIYWVVSFSWIAWIWSYK